VSKSEATTFDSEPDGLSRLVWTWTPEVPEIRKLGFESGMEQRRNEVSEEWTMEIEG